MSINDRAVFDPKDFAFGDQNIITHTYPGVQFNAAEDAKLQMEALLQWERERWKLHDRFSWSRQRLETWRLHRLSTLVDYAFINTSFYHELYSKAGYTVGAINSISDFEALPLTTRDHLQSEYPSGVVSRSVDSKSCKRVRTSGSSGEVVEILVAPERLNLDTFFKYRQFEVMTGKSLRSDRWLYNIHHDCWWYSSFLGRYPVYTMGQDCPAEAIIQHLGELRPQVISAISSSLINLAETGVNLRDLGVGLVSTNSESSSKIERENLERIFGVPVRDEYSSEELDIIAHECHYGEYHVVEDDCYVEITDSSDYGVGNVVGTDLWNFAMPVIRYAQNDLARITDGAACKCGSESRKLEMVHGREASAFYRQDGLRVSSGSLLEICDRHLVHPDSQVLKFQLAQLEYNQFELRIKVRSNENTVAPSAVSFVKDSLVSIFGPSIVFNVSMQPEIGDSTKTKRQSIVCEMKQ